MTFELLIGYLLIVIGIGLTVAGAMGKGFIWLVGGFVLASLGTALLQSGRRKRDGDFGDAAEALLDSLDD